MYGLLISLLQPYTIAYIITGVAVVSLWRRREAKRRGLVLLTVGFGLMVFLTLPVCGFRGSRFVGVVIPAAETNS